MTKLIADCSCPPCLMRRSCFNSVGLKAGEHFFKLLILFFLFGLSVGGFSHIFGSLRGGELLHDGGIEGEQLTALGIDFTHEL